MRRWRRPPLAWRSPASGAWLPGPYVTRRCGGLAAGDAVSARQSAAWLCFGRLEGAEDGKEKGWRV